MITIEMLPAQHGDCLWIEYGDPGSPRRILVDCGLRATYRELAERLRDRPEMGFELLVLSHIDADHINGAIPLLQELGPERFGDVWFNGWKHLSPPSDALGGLQGELFSSVLTEKSFPWNKNAVWDGKAVVVPGDGPLPRIELKDGLTLTLLSPTFERLEDLRKAWSDDLARVGMEPGDTEGALAALEDMPRFQPDALGARIDVETLSEAPFEPDDSAPNGSSIVLLAEHAGKAVLLGADAFSPVLETSIRRLLQERGRTKLRLDACKVPHHGARGNNGPGFLSLLDCQDFLVSTDGSHGYHHPHQETVARILTGRRGARLHFNYRSHETEIWDDPGLQRDWDYEALYPKPGQKAGYRLSL